MKIILPSMFAVVLMVPAMAQGTFTSYGTACNTTKLAYTGTPTIDKSFSFTGVTMPTNFLCTAMFCSGTCQRCNKCAPNGNYLLLGLKKIAAPITTTCKLLNTADFILGGTSTGTMTYKVPKDYTLIGQVFYAQRAVTTMAQWMGSNCASHVRWDGIVGMSDGVEGKIAL